MRREVQYLQEYSKHKQKLHYPVMKTNLNLPQIDSVEVPPNEFILAMDKATKVRDLTGDQLKALAEIKMRIYHHVRDRRLREAWSSLGVKNPLIRDDIKRQQRLQEDRQKKKSRPGVKKQTSGGTANGSNGCLYGHTCV